MCNTNTSTVFTINNLFQEFNYEDIKDKTKELVDKFKQLLNTLKDLLTKLKTISTFRHLNSLIDTFLRECPITEYTMKKYFPEDIDTRIGRIQDVNDVNGCMQFVYYILENVGRLSFRIFSIFYPTATGTIFDYIFDDENSYIDSIERSEHLIIYKYIYQKMVSEGISPSYATSWNVLLACLSPLYYLLYSFKKGTNKHDPEYYDDPILYDNVNDKTGFTKYESEVNKLTDEVIEAYKNCDNDFDKDFILSKAMLKQSCFFFGSMVLIFSPVNISTFGLVTVSIMLQYILMFYSFYIFIAHLIFAHKALEISKKQFKELNS